MDPQRLEYDAQVDPYAKQTFTFDLIKDRYKLDEFLEDFRKNLERSPPIGEPRVLKSDELVNLDVIYYKIRVRLKIKADDIYLIGFCLCKLTGTEYETTLHELRDPTKQKVSYFENAEAMGVDFRYPDFKAMKPGFKISYFKIIRAVKVLAQAPPEPMGTNMKSALINLMLLFLEGGRFILVGEDFSDMMKDDIKVITINDTYTDQILNWKDISDFSRLVPAGSTLDKLTVPQGEEEYHVRVTRRDTSLFFSQETKGAAAEQYIGMKCLEAEDFRGKKVVFKRNDGVPQDNDRGEEAGPSSGGGGSSWKKGGNKKKKKKMNRRKKKHNKGQTYK